jgi:hypothetical protein
MRSAIRKLRKETVVVHIHNGTSIKGILRSTHRDGVILSHASDLDEGVALKGEVVVPREMIDFYQVEVS